MYTYTSNPMGPDPIVFTKTVLCGMVSWSTNRNHCWCKIYSTSRLSQVAAFCQTNTTWQRRFTTRQKTASRTLSPFPFAKPKTNWKWGKICSQSQYRVQIKGAAPFQSRGQSQAMKSKKKALGYSQNGSFYPSLRTQLYLKFNLNVTFWSIGYMHSGLVQCLN